MRHTQRADARAERPKCFSRGALFEERKELVANMENLLGCMIVVRVRRELGSMLVAPRGASCQADYT